MLYETGCLGLVGAALIDRLGSQGTIIHVHPGFSDHPTQAVLALNLPKEQLDQLISVGIHKLSSKKNNEEMIPDLSKSDASNTELGKRKHEDSTKIGGKMRKKDENSQRALEILENKKVDGLVIVGKEHPSSIFKKLIKYLDISRPFVVYCSVREPLQELYCELKQRSDIIAVRLTESWLRDYQVLPDRTHPDIRISGSGGFLLSGISVCS